MGIQDLLPKDSLDVSTLEDRKIKEIEHSRQRRSILQGFERHADTHTAEKVDNLDKLTKNKTEFDKHFSNMKYYSVAKASEEYYQDWLKARMRPDVVALDYCAGNGECGLYMASCGGNVLGIDISAEGIANANQNARDLGLQDRCKFVVQDAENTSFPDNTFDVVVEYGALHHLEYPRAMKELQRIVKPTGEVICIEALRHNPFIHTYRKLTPHLRTAWEVDHIIGVEHLDVSRKYFGEVKPMFFHLAGLAAVPFRKTPLFQGIRGFLDGIDRKLLSNQAIGKYGWICVFTMAKPLK
jgi:ubiquinone/menaquinone biosynthesis C-methylase UbiE